MTELPPLTMQVTRASLVRYAGASGDFNPIHYSDRFATAIGLPGVVAHGMLTMAIAARVVTDWLPDPSQLLEYGVRFTKPVVVPDDDKGVMVTITGTVGEPNDDGTARVDITATVDGEKVLGQARALVRLEP
jgi:acyl dehydratase